MQLQSVLLLLVTMLLLVVSSWSLSVFMRLENVSSNTNYKMTKSYVNTGKIMGIITTILSIILLIIVSVNVYKNS